MAAIVDIVLYCAVLYCVVGRVEPNPFVCLNEFVHFTSSLSNSVLVHWKIQTRNSAQLSIDYPHEPVVQTVPNISAFSKSMASSSALNLGLICNIASHKFT